MIFNHRETERHVYFYCSVTTSLHIIKQIHLQKLNIYGRYEPSFWQNMWELKNAVWVGSLLGFSIKLITVMTVMWNKVEHWLRIKMLLDSEKNVCFFRTSALHYGSGPHCRQFRPWEWLHFRLPSGWLCGPVTSAQVSSDRGKRERERSTMTNGQMKSQHA